MMTPWEMYRRLSSLRGTRPSGALQSKEVIGEILPQTGQSAVYACHDYQGLKATSDNRGFTKNNNSFSHTLSSMDTSTTSAAAILGLGLIIGLRHALDADHLAAVSTIVYQQKNMFSSILIGGLWGVGHTISLLIAGVGVILLNIRLERYENLLELCAALMLIALGANVLYRLLRGGRLHFHEHTHGNRRHVHPHIHDDQDHKPENNPLTHHGLRLSVRPLIIGIIHGLAGSAALMLSVLATIESTVLAFAYIVIFGIGSIGGMMVMSLVLSLPARLTANHLVPAHLAISAISGFFSLGLGLFLVYEIGLRGGLVR
jgi:ABC-type nickel/cobalt efflux system permease component RcnA